MKTGINHSMRAPAPRGFALLMETFVAGLKFYDFAGPGFPLDAGQPLLLTREPDNAYDPKAVEVHTHCGKKLGYLPRSANLLPARLLDAGWPLVARIEYLTLPRPRRQPRAANPSPCRYGSAIEISVFVPLLTRQNTDHEGGTPPSFPWRV